MESSTARIVSVLEELLIIARVAGSDAAPKCKTCVTPLTSRLIGAQPARAAKVISSSPVKPAKS